ncbi:PucR family transcriptional regulator ligand-binding domain-containing protein [Paenibacillus sp. FSL R5-0407]|uniref:PucR family transcriptional regulator n=1 Tax=Paenibacillus sp. FSL R5-0407 TaxID=2975320 RepID=UPI0030F8F8D6
MLQLPSFRGAKVLAGKSSLHRIVSSLSVLEVSNADFSSKIVQTVQEEWYAEEIVISSLYTIKDSVEKQCETIQYLIDLGEVGLILYYVGIIVPKIPEEVLQLAESHNFIIICMPENDISLRYNEVIYEVMEAIVLDNQTINDNFVNETLEKVSFLPEHSRSVEIMLKLLSDRLKANLVLTNTQLDIANQVMWPRNSTLDVVSLIRGYAPHYIDGRARGENNDSACFIGHQIIRQKNGEALYLFVIKENAKLPVKTIDKIGEVVQVAVNLWGDKHNEVSEYALVKAILNDESEKMRRLAHLLHIDVAAVQMMWLVYFEDLSEEKDIREDLAEHLSKYYQTAVIQTIDYCIVVLLGNGSYKSNEIEIAEEYMETTSFLSSISEMVYAPRMRNTTDVRRMYQLVNQVRKQIHLIYHERKWFTAAEIRSMKRAVDLSVQGEEVVEEWMSVIAPVLEDPESVRTLMTFLLDAKGSFDECSQLLFVHKNTVKYRVKKISELLGYDITKNSEFYDVYLACMIYRLINS